MSNLFQSSVLKKYLAGQGNEEMGQAYAKFSTYFHNPERQENIRNSKEEQFQEGFLRELFVNILGYTINPEPNFNLTTELKNINNAKKTDGAIMKDGSALAVIELKGTDTKDLDKVNDQAFNYKNNQPDCVYVITSNFEKLRFYIHNAVEHEEFNLFTLTKERFELLWLLLQKDNLLGGIPAKVKEESLLAEEKITKALYNDYSAFKQALWEDMVQLNPQHDQLLLYKKSQKLLDRFLFIFFAEDKGLLPPNSISEIVSHWRKLKDMDEYRPMYDIFNKYFGYMNAGRKQPNKAEIHAYNGGLFAEDDVLDTLRISDEILEVHCLKLSAYNFESEVDTNILGHIFEHSLNDIENVRAQLEGTEVDKNKTKRKKDGVFYTPKYITKYIVDNTVGKLCDEQKAEIGIDEAEFAKDRKGRKKDTLKRLDDQLKQYRDWLLQLTICDPACGSGAFLNQALEFLMAEHRFVDELETQLLGYGFEFPGVEAHILEHNIYGVDINEESVEIARLSLWLRTAKKGRKLTTLSSNIKCGNSLIDDPKVAGDLAFNWQKEFPTVFREKDKRAYHITTATHDSRTSQRMIDHKVRLKRDNGTRPYPEAIWLELEDERIIAQTVAEIVKEDRLNVLALNICGDHMHLLLVCEEEEVPKIVGKIKAVSAKQYNRYVGKTNPASDSDSDPDSDIATRGHVPLSKTRTEDASSETRGHVPLAKSVPVTNIDLVTSSDPKSKSVPLWTQKFGCKDITSHEQLKNTVNYIENNRAKHELPHDKALQNHINSMVCGFDDAFDTEYKGGFDVVIGNPPYVRQELITPFKPYLEQHYQTFAGTADLYTYFIEMGVDKLIGDKGLYSIIVGNKWMRARFASKLRVWMKEKEIIELIDFGDLPVFENVAAYPVIVTLKKKTANADDFFYACEPKSLDFDDLNLLVKNTQFKVDSKELQDDGWSLVNKGTSDLLGKLKKAGTPLTQYVDKAIYRGILTGFNDAFVIDSSKREELIKADPKSAEIIKPFLAGRDVKRYYLDFQDRYLIFTRRGIDLSEYSAISEYLETFRSNLEPKPKDWKGDWKGRKPGSYKWYEIQDSIDYYQEFEKTKIEVASISIKPAFSMSYDGHYSNDKTTIIGSDSKALLAILNSAVSYFFIKNTASTKSGGFFEYKPMYISQFPIPKDIEKPQLIAHAGRIETNLKNLNQTISDFLSLLQSNFDLPKPSTKLQQWHSLDFKSFLAELKKAKVELTLPDEAKWMKYFNEEKAKANALQAEIDRIDKEIDRMVYQLYGLTEEEIKIVEIN